MNMIDYVKWRGDLDFKKSPFNDIDAMILSQLAGIDYTGAVKGFLNVNELDIKNCEKTTLFEVAKRMKLLKNDLKENDNKSRLLEAVGNSARFKDITASGFIRDTDEIEEKQFSAITFFLPHRMRFVAFRGTDGSIASWKENFNMVYKLPYAGQTDALKYIEKASKGFFVKLMLGGHSKGGNLAMYAAFASDEKIRKKIKRVFSFDGPGFCEELSAFDGCEETEEKTVSYMPESAVVGRMLFCSRKSTVVKSESQGLGQHSMFNWQVEGTEFVNADGTDEFSDKMTGFFEDWLNSVERQKRPAMIAEVFSLLQKHNINGMEDFTHLSVKEYASIGKDILLLSPENKDLLVNIVKESVSPDVLKGFIHLPE
nr:DUF2974 domain-containing protein [Lachnospiraceae bacterium]